MAWKRLDSVIAKVVDRVVNEVGEGVAAATAPDAVNVAKSRKGPEAVAPGQVREETTQPGKAPASLGNAKGRRAHPHELAPLGARQPLVLRVIEGGRPAEGGVRRAAFCASGEEGGPASKLIRVVGGRDHAATR
mgnify:CR=1 FL=1